MGDAKLIQLRPISRSDADKICKRIHYSGKVVQNSQIHLGAFVGDRCGGVMQFGPPMDRNRMARLVRGTRPREVIELNRMAFDEWMPRNGESRSIAMAMRIFRKAYQHLKWVVSFADGTRCGDGTIYRASGFVLTSIKKNLQILRMPSGAIVAKKTLDDYRDRDSGRYGSAITRDAGAVPLPGFQLRYVYFLKPGERKNLTCPEVPYSRIAEIGAGMYRGEKRAGSIDADVLGDQPGEGGLIPTPALQSR